MITEKQQQERMKYIGGSDAPIIMGFSSYKTPYALWLEKTGILEPSFVETDFQKWGNRLEPIIRLEFAERHNVRVIAPLDNERFSPHSKLIDFSLDTITHPFIDYMRGNLDGFIPEWNAVHEIKCSNSFMSKEWGESESDVIPMQYLMQVAHYVACTNADKAIISVLIGGYDYREYTYMRDLELEKMVIEAAKSFWINVQNNIPPNAITISDLSLMYPLHNQGKSIVIANDKRPEIELLTNIKKQIKDLQKKEDEQKFKIMEYMQDSECLTDENGKPMCTWKTNKKGQRSFLLKGV